MSSISTPFPVAGGLKLTFTEINATLINSNFWNSREFHEALISYNKLCFKNLKITVSTP